MDNGRCFLYFKRLYFVDTLARRIIGKDACCSLPLHTGVETEGKDDSQTNTKPFLPRDPTSPTPALTCRSHRALLIPTVLIFSSMYIGKGTNGEEYEFLCDPSSHKLSLVIYLFIGGFTSPLLSYTFHSLHVYFFHTYKQTISQSVSLMYLNTIFLPM